MKKFLGWLLQPPVSFWGYVGLYCRMLALIIAWQCLVISPLETVFPHASPDAPIKVALAHMTFGQAVTWVVPTVFGEEVMRLLPILLVCIATEGFGLLAAVTVFATAIAFGLWHLGNGIPLWMALASQGVGGLLLNGSYVLGSDGGKKPPLGFATAFAVHFSYDFILLVLIFGFGQ